MPDSFLRARALVVSVLASSIFFTGCGGSSGNSDGGSGCNPACDDSYQECNTAAVGGPVCVATTCHPNCSSDELCDQTDAGFACGPLSTGYINILAPDAGVFGTLTPLPVAALAGAPGGPTQVALIVEQGTGTQATALVGSGNAGIYTGQVDLSDAGFVSGRATVTGTVFWSEGGVELDAGATSARAITIDVDPPAFGVASTDRPWYSGVVAPGETAVIIVPITDVGAAGVTSSSATITVPGHAPFPANPNNVPASGSGNYIFDVPVSAFNTSAAFYGSVPYTVSAMDAVGNASTGTFMIGVDNVPPTLGTVSYDAGVWFGGGSAIAISANANDQDGGSGINPVSLSLVLSGGESVLHVGATGSVYAFLPTGSVLQTPGQQGPVPFAVSAADNAGNVTVLDGGAILVDLKPPAIGSTTIADGTAVSDGGWYVRDPSGSQYINVTTVINDDGGSGPASATVFPGIATPITSSVGTAVDAGTSYTVQVPTSAQAVNSETPLAINISGTDNVGNVAGSTTASATLRIDGWGPRISAVTFATSRDGLDADGMTPWYNQKVSTDILVTASIVDKGSGVASAQLVRQSDNTMRVDYGAPKALGNDVYQFSIKRAGGPVAAGGEAVIPFRVVAVDNVGNSQPPDDATHVSAAQLGIDGKAPSAALATSLYPPAGSGCDSAVSYCGHDGAHFWRKGETNVYAFTGSDTGSGVDTGAGASCSIAGSSGGCGTRYNSGSSRFEFTPDFSTATFASGVDGSGAVTVAVTVRDRAGNSVTINNSDVSVTRVKWIKAVGAQTDQLAGAPILTAHPTAQLIFGGMAEAGGSIASVSPSGALLWTAGKNGSTTLVSKVTANMAYSPTTNLLYVNKEGGTTGYAFHVAVDGVDGFASAAFSGTTGSPAIVTGSSEYGLVSDGAAHKLSSLKCTPAAFPAGGACTLSTLAPSAWTSSLTSPATDGTNVYLGHDGNGLSKVAISSAGVLTYTADAASFSSHISGNVALAGALYLGDANATARYRSFDPAALVSTSTWPGTNGAGASGSAAIAVPVVTATYLFGSFDAAHDGHLHAFDPDTGASLFTYPTDSTNLGNLSPVDVGSDGKVYFSDSANHELLAIDPAASTPLLWRFTGADVISIPASSLTTGATMDSAGTVYFGDSAGNVYALITDSPNASPATAGATWPRASFDNCNSANSAFACK